MNAARPKNAFVERFFFFCLCTILVFSTCSSGAIAEVGVTLRVALYPYVPDRIGLFHKIESIFEQEHPGVNLELVDDAAFLSDYYSGGLQKTNADVYEIDTILLSEMVKADKIAPLEFPSSDFASEVLEAVTREGKTYGVPHWLCGNFLFYRRGDSQIENARTWKELHEILKMSNSSMFIDFKGSSTLGEWYLTVLAGLHGLDAAQRTVMESPTVDEEVVAHLSTILMNCPSGFCRSQDLHDKTGYYSRAFTSGKARAYLGYSESLFYGLQYAMDNCLSTSGCLTEKEVCVRKLPDFENNERSTGFGWVDALAIDAQLTGTKKDLATEFIKFMVSDRVYRMVLTPEWGTAPRYLIPARKISIEGVPLYDQLYQAHEIAERDQF